VGQGQYAITFDRDLSACVANGTLNFDTGEVAWAIHAQISGHQVLVNLIDTFNVSSPFTNNAFSLMVVCGQTELFIPPGN
jgi:hypothetical protein